MHRRTVIITLATCLAGCTTSKQPTADTADGNTSNTMTASEPMTPLVTGTIGFESSRPTLTDATVSVRLEDISRADAPATVVAETVIDTPADCATVAGIPFTLTGNREQIDPQRRYAVAVHVDMDGSGDVTVGDYVNTKSYPVSIQDEPATLTIIVEQVDE